MQRDLQFEGKILALLTNLEKKLDNLPLVPENGFYTSPQVEAIFQIDDSTLSKMRRNKTITWIKLSDNTYRYPASQPLFLGEQPEEPHSQVREPTAPAKAKKSSRLTRALAAK